ncbi:MAG: glycosyltransferase [Sphingobacteriaceae bacterium]|nr:MAG: glycosyltransferase [Sphingobacteriaceae bacterium]
MKNPPLVSIYMITYNHEPYLAQAIESAMMQKTNFDYELVIGEDCSTDKTRDICLKYKQAYPDKIKLLLHPKNIGAINNTIETFKACDGKYVAFLEGDDYWTDSNKLQKQIDFLEQNPDYVICAHAVDELSGTHIVAEECRPATEMTYTIQDLAKRNLFHTASVVFRNGLFKEFPVWVSESPVMDYVFHMLNAAHGKLKYFPEVMAVYRRHNTGGWSAMAELDRYERWIKILSLLLTEPFKEDVIEELKAQKRIHATHYLKHFMLNDREVFLQKLKKFTADDPQFGNEWLFIHYPQYIWWLTDSKSYRLTQKLSKVFASLKKIVKSV